MTNPIGAPRKIEQLFTAQPQGPPAPRRLEINISTLRAMQDGEGPEAHVAAVYSEPGAMS